VVDDAAARLLLKYRYDAVAFVRERFKVEPDAWQHAVLVAYCQRNMKRLRIALQACAGPGKTAVLAWIGWHFLTCWGAPGEHPKGAVVSETTDNLMSNLWPELAKWRERDPYLCAMFEQSASRIRAKAHPETWFLDARSWPKSANADEQGRTLSGIHSRYTLFLIDESGKIPVAVLNAAEQSMSTSTTEFGRIIQAGNPLSRSGMLYHATVTRADQWFTVRITGDPDDPMRSPRIDIDWAREQIEKADKGRDDPWVRVYILGQFPEADINSLLSPEEVETAMLRAPRPEAFAHMAKILSVDVAFEGDDSTILCRRQGCIVYPLITMRGARPTEIAARVIHEQRGWDADAVIVDDTGGYGGGVIDAIRQAGFSPLPACFSEAAPDPRYANLRSYGWLKMAEWVRTIGALPKDPRWLMELTTPTYTLRSGRWAMEDKAQIKRRLHHSPDAGDALAIGFMREVAPRKRPDGGDGDRDVGKCLIE